MVPNVIDSLIELLQENRDGATFDDILNKEEMQEILKQMSFEGISQKVALRGLIEQIGKILDYLEVENNGGDTYSAWKAVKMHRKAILVQLEEDKIVDLTKALRAKTRSSEKILKKMQLNVSKLIFREKE